MDLAKRLECGQLAAAFDRAGALESGSKLHDLRAPTQFNRGTDRAFAAPSPSESFPRPIISLSHGSGPQVRISPFFDGPAHPVQKQDAGDPGHHSEN